MQIDWDYTSTSHDIWCIGWNILFYENNKKCHCQIRSLKRRPGQILLSLLGASILGSFFLTSHIFISILGGRICSYANEGSHWKMTCIWRYLGVHMSAFISGKKWAFQCGDREILHSVICIPTSISVTKCPLKFFVNIAFTSEENYGPET